MPAFSYRAIDASGKTVKGVVEGDSERQIRNQLRAKDLKPIAIQSVAEKSLQAGNAPKFSLTGSKKLSVKELSLVTRQLASLIQSGLPLDEALQIGARQARKEKIKGVLLQTRSRVVEGRSLAQAMAENPKTFDHMYRAMVRAGESTGFLGTVLERLAEYTESSQQIQQRIKSAMIYPVVLLSASVLVIGLLMVFMVPKLTSIFANSGQELPGLTKALISSSEFLSGWGGIFLVGIAVGIGAGFKSWLRNEDNRYKWHHFLLKIPLINELYAQADSARFASTLSILLSSGVSLVEALRISGEVLQNLVLRKSSKQVAIAVQEGSPLNKALEKAGVFPPMLVQMAASGEANGTLSTQLDHSARNQERELEMFIATALGLLEPITVLFMGGMVATIVLAVLMPMIGINDLV